MAIFCSRASPQKSSTKNTVDGCPRNSSLLNVSTIQKFVAISPKTLGNWENPSDNPSGKTHAIHTKHQKESIAHKEND
jgi:hypothetical protein